MKITKVSYGKTYPLGNYSSERIDLEAEVDPSEDIQFVVCNLKHECDTIHKKNNPQLHQEVTISSVWTEQPPQETVLTVSPTPARLSPEEVLSQLIEDAATPKALKWLEKPSQKYPKTKELYDIKAKLFESGK